MPKVTQEQANARRDEIVNACAKLYETTCFKDLTLKEIGKATSFTRTSIYNYFRTKEEIFLALLEREYDLWNEDLSAVLEENEHLTADAFAEDRERARACGMNAHVAKPIDLRETLRVIARCLGERRAR